MERTFYKLDIGGIVYLVDPATAVAYTYDLEDPTEIGRVIWTDPKAPPRLERAADWNTILTAKLAAAGATAPTQPQ
jgi:hypothetical protein